MTSTILLLLKSGVQCN